MDRQTAREELLQKEPDFLPRAKKAVAGKTTYICPSCGNGSGSTGDGITLDTSQHGSHKHYKCFKCGLYEDVVGLWKLHTGTTEDRDAFSQLYQHYGISVENDTSIHSNTYTDKEGEKKVDTPASSQGANNMDYYRECHSRADDTAKYLRGRGFSLEDIKKIEPYSLGVDKSFSKGTGGSQWEALIIPTSSTSYVARNMAPDAPKDSRYRKVGSSQLYNTKLGLSQKEAPVFIVEGELDALSLICCGAVAVGLGSTSNYRKLIDKLQNQKPAQPLILALDNDEDGHKTEELLSTELEKRGISFYRYSLYGEKKDANSLFSEDREALTEGIRKAVELAESAKEEELEAQKEEYLQNSVASHLQEFINGIADSVNTPYIPTGFSKLDGVLEGGLYEGLYIMGAISSLGKTTLALQIADNIASSGEDVLIFSLEMARTELMAKSISKLTLLDTLQNNGNMRDAKTTRGITTGTRYQKYSSTERELIQRAIQAYSMYASHIFIHEGIGDIGAEKIREEVEKHISFTGKKPVVLVDYLQIMAPYDVRATDKQNTDKAVLELKRLSRDKKIPILGVSSFNRTSYNGEVAMEAFKESGAIEYGSDVLMGLQFKGAGKKDYDAKEAKRKNPREVELVILKNRNGATGDTISYEYYPLFNYFKEV